MRDISVYVVPADAESLSFGVEVVVSSGRRFAHLCRLAYCEFQRYGMLPAGLDEWRFRAFIVSTWRCEVPGLVRYDGGDEYLFEVKPYWVVRDYEGNLEDGDHVFLLHHPDMFAAGRMKELDKKSAEDSRSIVGDRFPERIMEGLYGKSVEDSRSIVGDMISLRGPPSTGDTPTARSRSPSSGTSTSSRNRSALSDRRTPSTESALGDLDIADFRCRFDDGSASKDSSEARLNIWRSNDFTPSTETASDIRTPSSSDDPSDNGSPSSSRSQSPIRAPSARILVPKNVGESSNIKLFPNTASSSKASVPLNINSTLGSNSFNPNDPAPENITPTSSNWSLSSKSSKTPITDIHCDNELPNGRTIMFRQQTLNHLESVLFSKRLVIARGTSGCGKSQLARQLAHHLKSTREQSQSRVILLSTDDTALGDADGELCAGTIEEVLRNADNMRGLDSLSDLLGDDCILIIDEPWKCVNGTRLPLEQFWKDFLCCLYSGNITGPVVMVFCSWEWYDDMVKESSVNFGGQSDMVLPYPHNELPGLYFTREEYGEIWQMVVRGGYLGSNVTESDDEETLPYDEALQDEMFQLTAGHPGLSDALMCLLQKYVRTSTHKHSYFHGAPFSLKDFHKEFPTIKALTEGMKENTINVSVKRLLTWNSPNVTIIRNHLKSVLVHGKLSFGSTSNTDYDTLQCSYHRGMGLLQSATNKAGNTLFSVPTRLQYL